MNTSTDRTINLNTPIKQSHLNGLKKIVELGLAVANAPEIMDNAKEALRIISAATLDTEQSKSHDGQWHIRNSNSAHDTAFWSDTHGWTTEERSDRYTTEEAFNTVKLQVMASMGIVAHLHRSPMLSSHIGCEWVLYSPAAAANDNRGYWNASKGWSHKDDAGLHGYWAVGPGYEVESDCQWVNLQLMTVTDEVGLSEALELFCALNRLPYQSADELLFAERARATPNEGRIAWLEQFDRQWDQAISQGAKTQLSM